MALVQDLLISAPILQDYLVDKDTGFPLAAGVVTFFEDTQRQILKNWYYQIGNPGNYSFVAGPNPMTLSGVGTFTDAQGNDIIPFFYPYDETSSSNQPATQAYFVRVENANGELQFTRANFPFVPSQPEPGSQVSTLRNYIINGEFWRNFDSMNLTTPANRVEIGTAAGTINYYYQTLAPSAHDGFSMPDMIMLKDIAGSVDTLTFNKFPQGSSPVLTFDITPEYYLDWNCSGLAPGQAFKCIQFPLQLHISTLESVRSATITFHAKINSGASNYNILVQILQFTGTGQTTSEFKPIQTFNITTSWQKHTTIPFTLPDADSLALATTGDDALYVQFVFPPDKNFDIYFAKPQLYLSADIPTNNWDTYDEIDAVINTPRTGDVRTSLNTFQPFGWVPMDDGTIGNTASSATTRANPDTWPLFNLLWNAFNPGLGLTSPYIEIYTAFASPPVQPYSGNISVFGADAITDWDANKSLSLTKMLGRALIGTASDMPIPLSFSTNSTNTLTVTSGSITKVYDGMPVRILTYGGGASNQPIPGITYYIKILTPTTFVLFFAPELTVAQVVTISTSSTGTLIVPDGVIGQFGGLNFGDGSNPFIYQKSLGYPVSVGVPAAGALVTKNPSNYLNFFMKL